MNMNVFTFLPRGSLVLFSMLLAISSPTKSRVIEGQSLTLTQALQHTLSGNTELQHYPYYLRISDAQVLQAQTRLQPELILELENFTGEDGYAGGDQAEITLTLGQTLELGGKRQRRVSFAQAQTQQQQLNYDFARLDVLAATTRRFYDVLRLQELIALMKQRITAETQALQIVQLRVRAGARSQADASKMQLRLSRSEVLLQQLQSQHQGALMHLAAMWMEAPGFVAAVGKLDDLTNLPEITSIARWLEQAPAISQARMQSRLSEAKLQLARANGRANLDLAIGLRRFEATQEQAWLVSASMPLTFTNPNRGAIAEAEVQRSLSSQQMAWSRKQLELSAQVIYQSLQTQQSQLHSIIETLLPRAQQLLADTAAGYRQGRFGVLQWVDAQSELFALQRELIETRSLMLLQWMTLERLTGQPLLTQFQLQGTYRAVVVHQEQAQEQTP